jgi:RNA polymerase sigma-70 factor (ECF subfamily)
MGMTYIDDIVLVERFRLGDRGAAEQLISRYRPHAYRHAARLLARVGNTADFDAGDIVAEALLRVHRSLARFNGKCAFATWLYRIETNCFMDLLKKRRSGPPTHSYDAVLTHLDHETTMEYEDPGLSPFEVAALNEQARALDASIGKLPADHRELITHFYHDMLSHNEISEKLGMPVGTIKSRLCRARMALRAVVSRGAQ